MKSDANDENEKTPPDENLVKKKRKVKLYPGFQSSSEEIQQMLAQDKSKVDEIFGLFFFHHLLNTDKSFESTFHTHLIVYIAKKVIENFYGLNELEYDKTDSNTEVEEVNSGISFNLNVY